MVPTALNLQPILKNNLVIATPLLPENFSALFNAASDPRIWEQHPNKLRYQQKEFENYFTGAIASGGAFLVKDAKSNQVIGSSRYSDYNEATQAINIGYTFFICSCWGKGYNYALKKLMLNHIFQFVNTVNFYVGAVNKRSQISLERFGAIKTGEEQTAYYGEAPKLDYIYTITAIHWAQIKDAFY